MCVDGITNRSKKRIPNELFKLKLPEKYKII